MFNFWSLNKGTQNGVKRLKLVSNCSRKDQRFEKKKNNVKKSFRKRPNALSCYNIFVQMILFA